MPVSEPSYGNYKATVTLLLEDVTEELAWALFSDGAEWSGEMDGVEYVASIDRIIEPPNAS